MLNGNNRTCYLIYVQADVQYWQDSLEDEISTIRDLLDAIPGKSNMEKSSLLNETERKIRAAQGTKRSFKMEVSVVIAVCFYSCTVTQTSLYRMRACISAD